MLLQADFNKVYGWVTGNNMIFNENKFHHVSSSTTVPPSDHTYLSPGGLSIESQNINKEDCSF